MDIDVEAVIERAQIERVLVGYATALDDRNWAELSQVFLEDAYVEYEGIGRFKGLAAIEHVIRGFLDACGNTQHQISNVRIDLRGSQAKTQCYVVATHSGLGRYADQILTVWGEYTDELQRHGRGWRIASRRLSIRLVQGDIGVALKA